MLLTTNARPSAFPGNVPGPADAAYNSSMRFGRVLLFLLAAGVGLWLYKGQSTSLVRGSAEDKAAPIDRAKAAAEKSNARTAETAGAQTEADAAAPAAGVTENMTQDQVRALLGPPSDTRSETTDAGVRREIWTYSQAGKTVIFENGVAVSIR